MFMFMVLLFWIVVGWIVFVLSNRGMHLAKVNWCFNVASQSTVWLMAIFITIFLICGFVVFVGIIRSGAFAV